MEKRVFNAGKRLNLHAVKLIIEEGNTSVETARIA